jgi:hypothetical protein
VRRVGKDQDDRVDAALTLARSDPADACLDVSHSTLDLDTYEKVVQAQQQIPRAKVAHGGERRLVSEHIRRVGNESHDSNTDLLMATISDGVTGGM